MKNQICGIAFTHRGNFRSNNEDAVFLGPATGSSAECESITFSSFEPGHPYTLAAVADGVGGCLAGEEASQLSIESVRASLEQAKGGGDGKCSEAVLRSALENAHYAIVRAFQADPSKDGMATTFTGMVFHAGEATLIHIGDSRCYRYSNGEFTQESTDHSPVGEMVAQGRLTEEEALVHPCRSYIDRVLGNADKPIEPQISSLPLRRGDRWLLCSDGLSESICREQLEHLFKTHAYTGIDRLGPELMDTALKNAARDNVSLVLLEIGNPGLVERARRFFFRPRTRERPKIANVQNAANASARSSLQGSKV